MPDARPYPELLPCPFCGATGLTFSEGSTYRWRKAECVGCDATLGDHRTDADCVEAWNRRAALAAQPAPAPSVSLPQGEDAPAASQIDVLKAMRILGLSAEKLFRRIRDELREGHDAEARKMLDFVDRLVAAPLPQGEDARDARLDGMRQAARIAAIHNMYPAETERERGYGEGRRAAADAIHDAVDRLAASAPKGGEVAS